MIFYITLPLQIQRAFSTEPGKTNIVCPKIKFSRKKKTHYPFPNGFNHGVNLDKLFRLNLIVLVAKLHVIQRLSRTRVLATVATNLNPLEIYIRFHSVGNIC